MNYLSWLWDKYSDPPSESAGQAEHLMRQDIFYLKGYIEGMLAVINRKEKP